MDRQSEGAEFRSLSACVNRLQKIFGEIVVSPAIATERLSLARDGRVIYRLRRHWRDGTSAVSVDPLTFIERLAALVPRPRAHQHTYHGVLAPAAPYRDSIVPGTAQSNRGERDTGGLRSCARL